MCGYTYKRTQSQIVEWISHPNGILTISVTIVTLSITMCGLLASSLGAYFSYDAIGELCRAMKVHIFWRQCSWHRYIPSTNVFTNIDLCDPAVAQGVETFILGMLVVGTLGLIMTFIGMFQDVAGGAVLLAPVGWLVGMEESARVRVILALGSLLAARYVYLQVGTWARHVALLGETIEEYEEQNGTH